jgi:phosphatidylinositol alpha-1,6-mannosyltransferase
VRRHLLVTNDFPPKMGGIQSYLWELWRRLPPGDVTVLTTAWPGAADWDAAQAFRVERTDQRVLLPRPSLARRIDALADDAGADLVLLDPALPVGALGPRLRHPYGLVLHGAEVTVPGRLPGARQLLRRVLSGARLVVAAGGYPLAEGERAAGRALPSVVVPPGVDVHRFRPVPEEERLATRARFGLPADAVVVLGLSRLVPRKGFDTLLRAAAQVAAGRATGARPELVVAIGGDGRDKARLERLAAGVSVPVHFLGRVPEDDLPAVYGCADVFAMLCRNRWGGLEQEGFGIVFLEAAAAGIPQLAGRSGGSHEAVVDGSTGFVVDDLASATTALRRLVDDPDLRRRLGAAARARVEAELTYDVLAARLEQAIDGAVLGTAS